MLLSVLVVSSVMSWSIHNFNKIDRRTKGNVCLRNTYFKMPSIALSSSINLVICSFFSSPFLSHVCLNRKTKTLFVLCSRYGEIVYYVSFLKLKTRFFHKKWKRIWHIANSSSNKKKTCVYHRWSREYL
jgi:hypothetical protein